MNALTDKVLVTKEALAVALGDNWERYRTNMKNWFRNRWTKEEFDCECRKIMTPDKLHLHNQFLLALLNKIDAFAAPETIATLQPTCTSSSRSGSGTAGSSSSRKRKRSSRTFADRINFELCDMLEFVKEDNMQLIRPPTLAGDQGMQQQQQLPTQRYCAQELFLPDAGFIMGRFLIGAWEIGLISVEDSVAEYVAMAVQVLLKDLIASIIKKRKHYKTTGEGNFFYDVGAQLRDPSLRNTVTRQKVDDTPLEHDKELNTANFMRRQNDDIVFLSACEQVFPCERTVITLKDCQRAFRDRNLIGSHTVYSLNMERLNMMMH
ncbi:PREDICTED: transcriptional adapter 1-like isoform X1 [Drosophila arizonae]|uniref:Transcriptional adapter 1-like isoform X1 n=1 Tax=Drosophila arizonae TaxID=7263 RepID=A0ABM1NYS5_DROAR|nr:PREDICTED: transcriptional adapter 1-like isoform X1 [Drosophila arizonae]